MKYRERIYSSYISSGQAKSSEANIHLVLDKVKPYADKLIKKFLQKKEQALIYDLGCGYGKYLYFLKERGFLNLKAVDISAQQVELAHKIGLQKEVEHGEIRDFLKRHPEPADVILLMDILEHLTKDELFDLLDVVMPKIKQGGLAIIHVPNGEGIFGSRKMHGDLSHEVCFTPDSINQVLKIVGFRTISVYEDKPVVHGITSLLRRIIWTLGTIPLRILLAAETGNRSFILSQNMTVVAEK
jgi:predicted TPR repeat methyltransferase